MSCSTELSIGGALITTPSDAEKQVKKEKFSDKVFHSGDTWKSGILKFLPFQDVKSCIESGNKQLSSLAAPVYVRHPDIVTKVDDVFDKNRSIDVKDRWRDPRLQSLALFEKSPRYWSYGTVLDLSKIQASIKSILEESAQASFKHYFLDPQIKKLERQMDKMKQEREKKLKDYLKGHESHMKEIMDLANPNLDDRLKIELESLKALKIEDFLSAIKKDKRKFKTSI